MGYAVKILGEPFGAVRESADVAELPVSDQLRVELQRWAASLRFSVKDPGAIRSSFRSREDGDQFVERGARLVDRLQSELGEHWHVEYMPEPVVPVNLRIPAVGRQVG